MTPMQEHRAANPAPNPDDKHAVLGYLVEPEDVVKLTVICKQLHGGTDRERDYGHRLWLIINTMRDLPVTQGDLKPTSKYVCPFCGCTEEPVKEYDHPDCWPQCPNCKGV